MPLTYAIILAGGRGLRLSNQTPKQFLPLGEMPVIAWSMNLCESLPEIDRIIAVLPEDFIEQAAAISAGHTIRKMLRIIAGGATRQESSYQALGAVDFSNDDILLFHDAARPFVRPGIIRQCVDESKKVGAAAVYIPVKDTVAVISGDFVESVPPRERMFYAQTPQAFRYSIINSAHEKALTDGVVATDDVSLVLAAGFKVKKIEGDYGNFKITTDFDYQAACRMAETIHYKKQD